MKGPWEDKWGVARNPSNSLWGSSDLKKRWLPGLGIAVLGKGRGRVKGCLTVNQMRYEDRQEGEEREESRGTGNSSLQGGDGPGKEIGKVKEKACFLGEITDPGFYT